LARGFDLIQRSQNLSTKEWGQENDFSDSSVPILLSKKYAATYTAIDKE
jgi:hypothetical protein